MQNTYIYVEDVCVLLVNRDRVVCAVFRPHPVVVPGESLFPRDALLEQRALYRAFHAADRRRYPAAEYRGHEAIAKLHLQVGAVERLPQVSRERPSVFPLRA